MSKQAKGNMRAAGNAVVSTVALMVWIAIAGFALWLLLAFLHH
ncbi:hypothetical protein [Trebonia sp.]|nr:hypothetical protein [Trebonia sp.]